MDRSQSLLKAKDFEDELKLCGKLARTGGVGQTASLFTKGNPELVAERKHALAEKIPVGRVLVNSPTSLTAIVSAFSFPIDPSFNLAGTACQITLVPCI